MKILYLKLIIANLLACSVLANSISGSIQDQVGEPIYFANVVLYNAADTSIIKIEYSDENGLFQFSNVDHGLYFIELSYLGYDNYRVPNFDLDAEDVILDLITLEESNISLDEVVIKAKKPLLELKPNKVVMNVEGSINASGSDAFTLLRQAPGVVVDNNENIIMMGKGGVVIYIDGRPSPLGSQDLAAYLKTIPSSEIEAIEIITNPSAKYDAAGNAGIINIKFRKDKNLGTNGNASLSFAQGRRHNIDGTVRLTNRTKKLNLYGSLSAYDGEGWNPFNLYREQSGVVFDQNSIGQGGWSGVNYRAGADYFLNKKNTFGILIHGSDGSSFWNNESEMTINPIGSSIIDSILVAKSNSKSNSDNANINLNYKFDDGKGKSLNIDIDSGKFFSGSNDFQPNEYLSGINGSSLSTKDFFTETATNIDINTAKLDYEQALFTGQLSVGLKLSSVVTNNDFDFYNVLGGINIIDPDRTNQFTYDETVSAAYVNYNVQINSIGVQAGLRVEHTESDGQLIAMIESNNQEVKRSYTDFFPSLGLTWAINEKNNLQLNYSKRLNRPSYQDLNPFTSRIDELTFEAGNPFLNPEYAHNVQLSHSWNYKLTSSIGYSHTQDLIAQITDVEDEKGSFITKQNIADQYTYSANVSAPIPIKSWWNSYFTAGLVHTHNKASFENDKTINIKALSFNVYSQHSFSLSNQWTAEISGWYNSPSVWEGNFEMEEMFSIDAGIQKKFLNEKLSIKLSVSDIFFSSGWTGVTQFGGLYLAADGAWDSRRVRFNMSYSFGNDQVKNRNRKIGLEDEKNRIKSGR